MDRAGYNLQAQIEARDDALLDNLAREADERELLSSDIWERSLAIAHDPAAVNDLLVDGEIDWLAIVVKVGGRWINADQALHLAAIRQMEGLYADAECIGRDTILAIATAVEPLVRSGRVL